MRQHEKERKVKGTHLESYRPSPGARRTVRARDIASEWSVFSEVNLQSVSAALGMKSAQECTINNGTKEHRGLM